MMKNYSMSEEIGGEEKRGEERRCEETRGEERRCEEMGEEGSTGKERRGEERKEEEGSKREGRGAKSEERATSEERERRERESEERERRANRRAETSRDEQRRAEQSGEEKTNRIGMEGVVRNRLAGSPSAAFRPIQRGAQRPAALWPRVANGRGDVATADVAPQHHGDFPCGLGALVGGVAGFLAAVPTLSGGVVPPHGLGGGLAAGLGGQVCSR